MIRRASAAVGVLAAALCQAAVLPAALGGTVAATWLAWAVLFGGLGAAVALVARGDALAWWAAGGLALAMLDLSVVALIAGLPGQSRRGWDVPAVVALAGEVLVLLLWLATARPRWLLRAGALAGAALVAVVLLPLGGGQAAAPTEQALPSLAAHVGHDHAAAAAAPTPPPATADGAPLEDQLAAARAAAARYRTLADAEADGWTLADDYIAGIGSHYMRYDRIDSVFDPAQPEMLLFAGDQPDSPIVGVTYYVVHTPPAGFTGDQDVWHQHQNICMGPDGPRFAGDGATGCKARWDWSWMLHAWVVPGWENPDGVFATENPLV
jgi:hypothetical protein